MIINFKLFEGIDNYLYWIVRKDDDLLGARLHKIGAPLHVIKNFLRLKRKFDFHVPQDDFIQIGKRHENDWGFNSLLNSSYKKQKYQYMGQIDDLTEDDIENYNTIIDANKYNL